MLNPQAIEYFRQAHGFRSKGQSRIDFDKTPDPYHYIVGIPSEPVIPAIDPIEVMIVKANCESRLDGWIHSAMVSHYRLILVRLAIIRAIEFSKTEREIKNTERRGAARQDNEISVKIDVPALACNIPQHHPLKTESYLIRLSAK